MVSTARGKSFTQSTSRTRWGKVPATQPPPPRKTLFNKAKTSVTEVEGSQELMIKLLEERVQHINGLLRSGSVAGPPDHMQQMKDLKREYQLMISQQKAKFAPRNKSRGTKKTDVVQRRANGSTFLRDISPRLKAYEPIRSSSSISNPANAGNDSAI